MFQIGEIALNRKYQEKFDFEILGPSPAPLLRVKKKYHYRILLKYDSKFNIQNFLLFIVEKFRNNREHIKIDINY